MKLTDKDIKTLMKIKKLCDKAECEKCKFYRVDHFTRYCALQTQPNWWNLEYLLNKENKENE